MADMGMGATTGLLVPRSLSIGHGPAPFPVRWAHAILLCQQVRELPPKAWSWPSTQNLLAIWDSAQAAGVSERVNVIFHSPHLL